MQLLSVIGENFDEGDEICGAVVSIRKQQVRAVPNRDLRRNRIQLAATSDRPAPMRLQSRTSWRCGPRPRPTRRLACQLGLPLLPPLLAVRNREPCRFLPPAHSSSHSCTVPAALRHVLKVAARCAAQAAAQAGSQPARLARDRLSSAPRLPQAELVVQQQGAVRAVRRPSAVSHVSSPPSRTARHGTCRQTQTFSAAAVASRRAPTIGDGRGSALTPQRGFAGQCGPHCRIFRVGFPAAAAHFRRPRSAVPPPSGVCRGTAQVCVVRSTARLGLGCMDHSPVEAHAWRILRVCRSAARARAPVRRPSDATASAPRRSI